MKFYINQLMEEKKMSLTEEVKAKEEVWDARDNIDALFREATQALASKTRTLTLGTIDSGDKLWHSGYANIFSNPEFADALLCESLFGMLEEVERINQIFFERELNSPIDVLFGEELGWQNLDPVSVIVTKFKIGNKNAALGIIGPSRISYPEIIPILRYYGNLLEEIAGNKKL
jgi:transcriptional regulator of heat shock response